MIESYSVEPIEDDSRVIDRQTNSKPFAFHFPSADIPEFLRDIEPQQDAQLAPQGEQ